MNAQQDYDLIIIGSGAGGGTLAHHLAPTGKRILILERGGWLPREVDNWDAQKVFVDNRYVSKDIWHDKDDKPFQPGVHYFVGGATKMFGAALFRLRPADFGEIQHHGGISPAWPISYQDFEPYYLRAEQLYQVHGLRGEDPTEGPSSGPYNFPPISHEPVIEGISDAWKREGYHPFHAPTAVMLNEAQMHNGKCIRCNSCDGFPCMVLAKCDAENICIRPALEHPNVTLLTDASVYKLETSPSGREVTRVLVDHQGEKIAFSGNIIALSAGASNSARILLLSANDQHPHGLANGSDQVGRNFMFHNSDAVVALSRRPNDTIFQKTLSCNDFYFKADDFDFPLGNIQMIGKTRGPMFRADAGTFAPGFVLTEMATHSVDFWLTTEDLPMADNRVTLNKEGGIGLNYTFNNQEATHRLREKMKILLGHAALSPHLIPNHLYMSKSIPIAGVAHQSGTIRFGTDAARSVLDIHCKAHELDNLYVVDTSFFPSIGAVNPSLTAMANALRVGDHLKERLR